MYLLFNGCRIHYCDIGSGQTLILLHGYLKRVNLPSDARLVVLSNSGHLGFIEEEGLSIKTLRDFISSLG